VVLTEGSTSDHHFLKHKSYVAYSKLQTYSAVAIESQVQKGTIEDRGLIDERVFALICKGIGDSREAAPKFQSYYRERTEKKLKKD
jgi:hypothetical protein